MTYRLHLELLSGHNLPKLDGSLVKTASDPFVVTKLASSPDLLDVMFEVRGVPWCAVGPGWAWPEFGLDV